MSYKTKTPSKSPPYFKVEPFLFIFEVCFSTSKPLQ
jgi:hypothetical protein